MYKYINLYELTKLIDNETVSENYIRYILSWDSDKQYRHSEIKSIKTFLDCLDLDRKLVENFIYSYEIKHLNKEFDLLKVFEDSVVNIEIKSRKTSDEKIIKQLNQNAHYLSMIPKPLFQYCFIASEKKLVTLLDGELKEVAFDELAILIALSKDDLTINLDDIFKIGNVLVSPLNNPMDFYEQKYLLTEYQENIKRKIYENVSDGAQKYYAITGNAGTGKTLLLYDIAKNITVDKKVLIVHSGIECEGHRVINKLFDNIYVIPASKLQQESLEDFKYFFVDESHRLYFRDFIILTEYIDKNDGACCVFSFDEKQRMSKSENESKTLPGIKEKCADFIYELKNTIRYNKKVAIFVAALMDLNKPVNGVSLDNIHIVFEASEERAVEIAKRSEMKGYKYISYTPSSIYADLDYQKSVHNTHKVIGQEFDKVCMILNDKFRYDRNNKLQAVPHPNPNYLFTKLLYQGLTRAREEILLIVTNDDMLDKVISIFKS